MDLLADLQKAVMRPEPGPLATLAWVAAGVAVPTLARLALTPVLGASLPFSTYYPTEILITLFLGWRAGLGVLLLSVAAANFFFHNSALGFDSGFGAMVRSAVFLFGNGLIFLTGAALRASLRGLGRAAEVEKRLNDELRHRLRNTLAVVQGLVVHTARQQGDDPEAFQHQVLERLQALGAAHDILATGRWEACELSDLTARALAPFRREAITLEGPPCRLRPESCVPLVLALHELATNALKYGALSSDCGRVGVVWSPQADGVVALNWTERGGPPVAPPTRRGLGSRLLAPQPGLDQVAVAFDPEGVTCAIRVRAAP